MLCIVNRRNNYKEDNKKNVKSLRCKINLFPRLSRREFGKAFMRYQQCAQRVADFEKKRPYANCKKKPAAVCKYALFDFGVISLKQNWIGLEIQSWQSIY